MVFDAIRELMKPPVAGSASSEWPSAETNTRSAFCRFDRSVWLFSIEAYQKPTGHHLGALSYPKEIK